MGKSLRKRKQYNELTLIPSVIAETVVSRTYTGEEISLKNRDFGSVVKTEQKRKQMTPEQREEFIRLCDTICRKAYDERSSWFAKCLKSTIGRDQLYMWISHWLASYLNNPEILRRNAA